MPGASGETISSWKSAMVGVFTTLPGKGILGAAPHRPWAWVVTEQMQLKSETELLNLSEPNLKGVAVRIKWVGMHKAQGTRRVLND